MKPNIFIVGPTSTGKSSSLRNLDPTNTAILNSEQKALPFRSGLKFTMNKPVTGLELEPNSQKMLPSMTPYWNLFEKAIESKNVKVLVNESFTSLTEQIYAASKRFFSGFDLWGNYNEEITKVLHRSKNTEKYVVFLGTDMIIEGENGVEERCISVQGNRWKKNVEKEFVIVLYTQMITNDKGESEYRFITNKMKGFENIPAKSPMGMLPPTMPNDLNLVIEYIEKYYNEEEVEEAPQKEATE